MERKIFLIGYYSIADKHCLIHKVRDLLYKNDIKVKYCNIRSGRIDTGFIEIIFVKNDVQSMRNLYCDGYYNVPDSLTYNFYIRSYKHNPIIFCSLDDMVCCISHEENYTKKPLKLQLNSFSGFGCFNNVKMHEKIVIEKVIFNDPATIVFWNDGTKTVVKVQDDDTFDPEKGLTMAISKKFFGNKGNYYNEIKKWLPEEDSHIQYTHVDVEMALNNLSRVFTAFSNVAHNQDKNQKSKVNKLNLNSAVKVKLNDYGKLIYKNVHSSEPMIDKEGFSSFQLWRLMNTYGNYLRIGKDSPFTDFRIYIEDDDLETVK